MLFLIHILLAFQSNEKSPIDVGEVFIGSTKFPKHTLARQGNTVYLILKKDFFTPSSYNIVPPQIIPISAKPDHGYVNLAGKFLCFTNDSPNVRACLEHNLSAWHFAKIPNTANYQMVDALSKKCMAVGSYIETKNAYLLVEKPCDQSDKSQLFFGTKVSSKTEKNITYLNAHGKEVPEPEIAN